MKQVSVSQSELAAILDVSVRWIQRLEGRNIFKKKAGKYDLQGSVTAYVRFLRGAKDRSLAEAQRIHLETKTKKLRIESEKMLGNLVPREQKDEEVRAHVELGKENLQNLGWRLAGPLLMIEDPDEKDFALTIQYAVDKILRVMSGEKRPETPVILPGRGLFLQIGLIKPDPEGNVILDGKRVKADELLERWGEDGKKT